MLAEKDFLKTSVGRLYDLKRNHPKEFKKRYPELYEQKAIEDQNDGSFKHCDT